jgi:hypothetical protein
MKDNSIKKLDPGKAKPIDISKTGAIRLVKVQNATGSKADIKVKGNNKTIEELIEESNKLKNQPEEMTEEKINELRELVKVERVKKDNPVVGAGGGGGSGHGLYCGDVSGGSNGTGHNFGGGGLGNNNNGTNGLLIIRGYYK